MQYEITAHSRVSAIRGAYMHAENRTFVQLLNESWSSAMNSPILTLIYSWLAFGRAIKECNAM